MNHKKALWLAIGPAIFGSAAQAHETSFSDFQPMVGDVGEATLPEEAPYRLSSPNFSQETLVARDVTQADRFDSGAYDMHTANETGRRAGRYLFTVFETDQAGIQRTDLRTRETTTIWFSPPAAPALDSHVAFDASRWTPWGSFLTAEESWSDPGAVMVTDPNGLEAIDGRATPKLAAFLGTKFDRPEDLEIKTLKGGKQLLFIATTTNHKVFSIDLSTMTVRLFADQNTRDMATGLPVADSFKNPDNLAIDAEGNIYIVEDQPGGVEDIWFAQDRNKDGVAEAIGKWASLSTKGAESTGLYFDKFRRNVSMDSTRFARIEVEGMP